MKDISESVTTQTPEPVVPSCLEAGPPKIIHATSQAETFAALCGAMARVLAAAYCCQEPQSTSEKPEAEDVSGEPASSKTELVQGEADQPNDDEGLVQSQEHQRLPSAEEGPAVDDFASMGLAAFGQINLSGNFALNPLGGIAAVGPGKAAPCNVNCLVAHAPLCRISQS